jgi:hypothetical protein
LIAPGINPGKKELKKEKRCAHNTEIDFTIMSAQLKEWQE